MNFYSIRDLRSETKNICEKVRQGGEVVITNNGKPSNGYMIDSEIEEEIKAARSERRLQS